MAWGLILLSLLVLAVSGVVLNRALFKGERAAFIMELPLYHAPNWRTIGLLVWQRTLEFLKKAGTIILLISVVVWALSRLPYGDVESSLLAGIGRLLAPVGALMGLNWRMMVALLTSFIAKENSIASLGILFGSTGLTASSGRGAGRRAGRFLSPPAPQRQRAADQPHPPRLGRLGAPAPGRAAAPRDGGAGRAAAAPRAPPPVRPTGLMGTLAGAAGGPPAGADAVGPAPGERLAGRAVGGSRWPRPARRSQPA